MYDIPCIKIRVIQFFRSRKDLTELQNITFREQTFASCFVYIPTLITILVLVNTRKSHCYDSEVIYDNLEFNTHLIVLIAMGLISAVLSLSPNIFQGFEKCIDAIKL